MCDGKAGQGNVAVLTDCPHDAGGVPPRASLPLNLPFCRWARLLFARIASGAFLLVGPRGVGVSLAAGRERDQQEKCKERVQKSSQGLLRENKECGGSRRRVGAASRAALAPLDSRGLPAALARLIGTRRLVAFLEPSSVKRRDLRNRGGRFSRRYGRPASARCSGRWRKRRSGPSRRRTRNYPPPT